MLVTIETERDFTLELFISLTLASLVIGNITVGTTTGDIT